jgi:hypothetical protein
MNSGASIMTMAMFVLVMAAVQAVIVVVLVVILNINHFPFDDGRPGAFGSNGCTCGTANGAPDDGPVATSDGRTHGCPGAAAEGAADYSASIDAAGESGGREGGQGEEYEGLLACHVDPFM